jgi:prepilin signal peptidase PulO-like enzyme (type II secretory pathway)
MRIEANLEFVVAGILGLLATVTDLRKGAKGGRIPDWLTFGGMALGVVLQFALAWVSPLNADDKMPASLRSAGFSLSAMALCAIVPLILYRHKAMGFGDVKLLIALGSILQLRLGVEVQLYGFVLLAMLSPAWLAYEGKLGKALKGSFALLFNAFVPASKKQDVDASALSWFRFAPFSFVATLMVAALHWKA